MRNIVRGTQTLYMRFDKTNPPKAGCMEDSLGDVLASRPPVQFAALPENMKPKQVSANFRPFPLPINDAALGLGPAPSQSISEMESSPRPLQQKATVSKAEPSYVWADEFLETAALQAEHLFGDDLELDLDPTREPARSDTTPNLESVGSDLVGYQVGQDFPYVDRLECHRSVDDLLAQFMNRPQMEARTATVLDFASSMHRRTDEELGRMFHKLSSIFSPNGQGLRFFSVKRVKFGRPYFVSNSLMQAFILLIEAATETFTVEQRERLVKSPSLYIHLLNFLALVKVFQPNLWFSPNPNMLQNRADYSHAKGTNRTVAYRRIGEELFDHMTNLVSEDREGERTSPFLHRCSMEQLLDLLGGFAGVVPDGEPGQQIVDPILREIFRRWVDQENEIHTPAEVENLERLYWLMKLLNLKCDALLNALFCSSSCDDTAQSPKDAGLCGSRVSISSLRLDPALRGSTVRGPNFFSGVSREKEPTILYHALKELHRSLAVARKTQDIPLELALAESAMALLMVLPDKHHAVRSAQQEGLDQILLQNIPGLETVMERLKLEEAERAPFVRENLSDVQSFLSREQTRYCPRYFTQYREKFVHPIRTFLSDLFFVNSLDNLFLLHSSMVEKSESPLVTIIQQRGRSGKDALVVTTSTLRALEMQMRYTTTLKRVNSQKRALEVIGYELEQGRAILLPFTEELLLHDAQTYCDEDLMFWTVAAFLARELPLVKVHTLMSPTALASKPYHTLKGEHSVLSSTEDLYMKGTPLLQALRSKELRAVTHSAVLQLPVRDRRTTLYQVNPARTQFLYRRDKALFDKYHVTARNLAPGFSQGALASDLRGLGFYTPDHPQVPYTPLPESLRKHMPNQA